MLGPAAEALGYLNREGFVHGRVAPSNILAIGNQLKLSTDSVRKIGETAGGRKSSAYDAPEVATLGLSPAADVWSLGMTLVAVLTQNAPKLSGANGKPVAVPNTVPQPLREIARQCLQADPQQRCTVHDIVRRLRAPTATTAVKTFETQKPQPRPKRWVTLLVILATLLVVAWVGSRVRVHRGATPAHEINAGASDNSASQPAVPFSAKPSGNGLIRGAVLHQVMPQVSRGAQNTVTGKLKVSVQVAVDAAGNVTQAKFVTHGPSQYFASKTIAAAQQWKFTPPRVNGQAVPSDWLLRFQIGRGSIQALPAEVKP
jgi:TonB family protein